jgi:hypothetical protein
MIINASKITNSGYQKIFGSLNIGFLTETNAKTIENQPIFKNEKGELFFCSQKMKQSINDRITILNNDKKI